MQFKMFQNKFKNDKDSKDITFVLSAKSAYDRLINLINRAYCPLVREEEETLAFWSISENVDSFLSQRPCLYLPKKTDVINDHQKERLIDFLKGAFLLSTLASAEDGCVALQGMIQRFLAWGNSDFHQVLAEAITQDLFRLKTAAEEKKLESRGLEKEETVCLEGDFSRSAKKVQQQLMRTSQSFLAREQNRQDFMRFANTSRLRAIGIT
ncbi:MAG TPA: hypothetical protein VHE99_04450 [Gammaproteobacteria bacterium]|nr:hypothetical protein [Gammaproteobacteria bacterium]